LYNQTGSEVAVLYIIPVLLIARFSGKRWGVLAQQLDATLSRDLRLGAQGVSIQLRANNVLNSVYFGAIDTTVNSPTFGQVVSFRPRRSVQLNLRFRY
jgi:hypothetical protein